MPTLTRVEAITIDGDDGSSTTFRGARVGSKASTPSTPCWHVSIGPSPTTTAELGTPRGREGARGEWRCPTAGQADRDDVPVDSGAERGISGG